MSILLSSLCVLLASPALQASGAESLNNGSGWSLATLDLELFIVPEEPEILYTGSMLLTLEAERSQGPDILLKGALAKRIAFMEAEGAQSSEPRRFEHQEKAGVVSLRFPEALERGAQIRVEFEYVGACRRAKS